MDFIVKFPSTMGQFNSIWVIINHLTKLAYFLPVKTTFIVD